MFNLQLPFFFPVIVLLQQFGILLFGAPPCWLPGNLILIFDLSTLSNTCLSILYAPRPNKKEANLAYAQLCAVWLGLEPLL